MTNFLNLVSEVYAYDFTEKKRRLFENNNNVARDTVQILCLCTVTYAAAGRLTDLMPLLANEVITCHSNTH